MSLCVCLDSQHFFRVKYERLTTEVEHRSKIKNHKDNKV